jgi:hypothetical protein
MSNLFPQKQPTPGLCSSPATYEVPQSNRLESRVDHVRGSLLSAYPLAQQPISEPLPLPPPPNGTMAFLEHSAHDAQVQDDIDKPLTADGSVDHTATPPRLITSTPPVSVKPRSAYARRIIASQTPKRPGRVEFIVSGSTGLRKSRKSVRTSLALLKRPSLFGPPLSDPPDEGHTDDADRVCDANYSRFFSPIDLHSDNQRCPRRILGDRKFIYHTQVHPITESI